MTASDDDDWHLPHVAPRHQVLCVDIRSQGRSAPLPDESDQAWPAKGLQALRRSLAVDQQGSTLAKEVASPQLAADLTRTCLDKLDLGVVPRLLLLGLREPHTALEVLRLLHTFAKVPEAAAEILRSQTSVQHLGQRGRLKEQSVAAAESLLRECADTARESGMHAVIQEDASTLEDPHWFAFGSRHYVLRFDAAIPEVPQGGAPPPFIARLATFGCSSKGSVTDSTSTRRIRTGARLWCAEVLLAREFFGELNDAVQGKVILELGCGLALAGTAALLAGAAACVLTDVEPSVLQAARTTLACSSIPGASRACTEVLDLRDLCAVGKLSEVYGVTAVLASDLVYGLLQVEDVACAVVAALPHGGVAWLAFPVLYRIGMARKALSEALAAAGLVVCSVRRLSDGGAHAMFSACEEAQEYYLYEAMKPLKQPGLQEAE